MTASPSAILYDAALVARLLGLECADRQGFNLAPDPVEGYLTFFDPGLSILNLDEIGDRRHATFCPDDWFIHLPFAAATDQPCFRHLCMTPARDSLGKTFAEQLRCLKTDEEVPAARTVLTGMMVHYLATRQVLYYSEVLRCKDTTDDGERLIVGCYDKDALASLVNAFINPGFFLELIPDAESDVNLGLASARNR